MAPNYETDKPNLIEEFKRAIGREAICVDPLSIGKKQDIGGYFSDIFERNDPIEQFAIGQGGDEVYFSNYSETPFSAENIADCEEFIDLITQYFGDKAYDYVQDVVVLPFEGSSHVNGFVTSGTEGIIFLNNKLLSGSGNYNAGVVSPDEKKFLLYVMLHEFGHLLYEFKPGGSDSLLRFAEDLGWDVAGMSRAELYTKPGSYEPSPRATPLAAAVRKDTHLSEILAWDDFMQRRLKDATVEPYYVIGGAPSDYGYTSPSESYAETFAGIALEDDLVYSMPHLRDAWLRRASREGDVVASPIARDPIESRRTL